MWNLSSPLQVRPLYCAAVLPFYRAAFNAWRSSREKSVCPFVCQMHALWQNGRKIYPDFYTVRKIICLQGSFLRKRMVSGGDPFYLKFWVNWPPLERNCRFWTDARSASGVTPSEKSLVNTYRKSATRLPVSLRWSSYVPRKPPKGCSKPQNGRFGVKSYFTWRKSATNFLCVKTVNDKVVRHAKMIGGWRTLLP